MQQSLNMLQTSQQNNKITANEELNRPFDWNKTPMAPRGNNAVAIMAPDNHNTYSPNAEESYVVGMAPLHYFLLDFLFQQHEATVLPGHMVPFHCIERSRPFQNKTQ